MVYSINKGRHKVQGFHCGLTFRREIHAKVSFDSSCLYDLKDSDNYDVNKLFGFSTSYFHHRQSARIGWRCIDGLNIQLLTYTYDKGKRQEPQLIKTVKPNRIFTASIFDNRVNFGFEVKIGEEIFHKRVMKTDSWFPFRYYLYPYFGGNKTAPHDMIISVDRI